MLYSKNPEIVQPTWVFCVILRNFISSSKHFFLLNKSQRSKAKTILKAVKEITSNVKPIRIAADLPILTLKARISWNEVFQALKINNFQPRLIYTVKLPSKLDG